MIERKPHEEQFIIRRAFGTGAIGFILQFLSLYWYQKETTYLLIDSGINGLAITTSIYVIGNMLGIELPSRKQFKNIVIWLIVLAALSVAITRFALSYSIQRVSYFDFFDLGIFLRFIFNFLVIACVTSLLLLSNFLKNQQISEQHKLDAERLAKEAELYNLRQQLQPHFLFNSLNSIISLIDKNPSEARDMTFQLSDFLRGTLHKDHQQLVSFIDEMEHLQLYLDIEKVRFGHRLETNISYPQDGQNYKLPIMILQPLVENAIKHGLYGTTDHVAIFIAAKVEDHLLHITIENPYDSALLRNKKGTGFGLNGIQRRLFLLYGRTDLLEITQENARFRSVIKIPQV